MHVDIDGDGTEDSDDQVTTWTYGVAKGASAGDSKIGSGSLLLKVVYPPQSGGQSEADRKVSYAFNAQGQVIWTKEHELNVTEFDYDTSGRQTHKRLTTLDASFDNHVKRISTTYDSLGRRQLVTQYSDPTVGSGTLRDEGKFSYDAWGNLEKYEQDNDSAVGSGGSPNDYEVSYTYAKATSGRNTVRRTSVIQAYGSTTLATVSYEYDGTSSQLDDESSRVTRLVKNTVELVEYEYNGVGTVVGIDYRQPDIFMHRYGATSGVYPDLDRFNRVTSDVWWKDLSTDLTFYDIDITYDRNSNITLIEDNVYNPTISAGYDAQYTMDNLNRLTKDEQGNWNGSAITSRSRQQIWTLDQVGNWAVNRVDRNGDNDFVDLTPPEIDDQRAHNNVNELIDRDLDTDGDGYDDTHYDLTYNKRGDLTDDNQNYKYVYDGFGRLRKVQNQDTPTPKVVEEFWSNGLGHRISWRYDTNASGEADGSDVTFHFGYDERWRMVATYRSTDISPKELFVYHCAGADDMGGSSYIDAVVLREMDANASGGWAGGAADGTLEVRDYYCQNWRADVVALITSGGGMRGMARYSAYGIPFGIAALDTNGDGTVNSNDGTNITNWTGTGAGVTNPTGDYDLNGNIDSNDSNAFTTRQNGVTLGWGKLAQNQATSGGAVGANRKGYAGYEFDPISAYSMWHVRYRPLISEMGRWIRKDPIQYRDFHNPFNYGDVRPLSTIDPMGLATVNLATVYLNHSACPHEPVASEAQFAYKASNVLPVEKPGWYIQKVDLDRDYVHCTTGQKVKQKFVFWERSKLISDPAQGLVNTDWSTPTAILNPSHGKITSVGRMAWVGSAWGESFGDNPAGWTNLPGDPSGNPGTTHAPAWWQFVEPTAAVNAHVLKWDCCYGCGFGSESGTGVSPAVTPWVQGVGPGTAVGSSIVWWADTYYPARELGTPI